MSSTPPKTSDAVNARLQLAEHYGTKAKQYEDLAALTTPSQVNTHTNLTNLAQRMRTYESTARRMAGEDHAQQ